jgi:hypothetical protein
MQVKNPETVDNNDNQWWEQAENTEYELNKLDPDKIIEDQNIVMTYVVLFFLVVTLITWIAFKF